MASRSELVEAFEAKVGRRLPDDYRQFLLDGPVPHWGEDEGSENPYTDPLHSFYDLGDAEDWRSLTDAFDNRPAELPDWFLDIGEQFGVSIGLGLDGPRRGRVYRWTMDSFLDDGPIELAASFGGFLAEAREREADWEGRRR